MEGTKEDDQENTWDAAFIAVCVEQQKVAKECAEADSHWKVRCMCGYHSQLDGRVATKEEAEKAIKLYNDYMVQKNCQHVREIRIGYDQCVRCGKKYWWKSERYDRYHQNLKAKGLMR